MGIAAARQQRDKAREQIAAGLDPAAEKRIETLARKVAADNTFKTIAEEWVAKNEREGNDAGKVGPQKRAAGKEACGPAKD